MSTAQTTLLTTKLFPPRAQARLVERPQLASRLSEIPGRRLTLVSAPAGFGKTTAIASALATTDLAVAWLSLDAAENELRRFLSYLLASLRTVAPEVGEELRRALLEPQLLQLEPLLSILTNELAAIPDERGIVLVLDDYHLIERQEVHDVVLFLLEHAPPSFHVVLTTRSDPPFPLARLRVRGDLLELRAGDLRFDEEDVSRLFSALLDRELSDEQLRALRTKTEGWVAGLQMAALSMQGREDIEEFIAAFTGVDRYVLDYLVEEALQRLPGELQGAMLKVSILERMNASLAEVVGEVESGADFLEELERRNLFLIPLDNRREWYRFHHLFADLLRHRLQTRLEASEIADLHERAARWHSQMGLVDAAIDHATKSGRDRLLVEVIDRHWSAVLNAIGPAKPFGIDTIPASERTPRVQAIYGWWLAHRGEIELLEEAAHELEGIVTSSTGTEGDLLRGHAALLLAIAARDRGDAERIIEHGNRALALIPDLRPGVDDSPWLTSHGVMHALVGDAYHVRGEVDPAIREYELALAIGHRNDDYQNQQVAYINLAREEVMRGRLTTALRYVREARELAQRSSSVAIPPANLSHIHATILLEQYELDEAEQIASNLLENPRRSAILLHLYRTIATTHMTRGDLERAEGAVEEMGRIAVRPGTERFLAIAPMTRAEIALRLRGDVEAGLAWGEEFVVHEDRLAQKGTLVSRARAMVLYANILARASRSDDAADWLDRVEEMIAGKSLVQLGIEAAAVRAIVNLEREGPESAWQRFAPALALGAPEGFVRTFVIEQDRLGPLLSRAVEGGRREKGEIILPTTWRERVATLLGRPLPQPPAAGRSADNVGLTSREMEILQLLALGYSNRKIADKLYVSINTVKTHTSNLFDKLGVNSRLEALARAREQGFLVDA